MPYGRTLLIFAGLTAIGAVACSSAIEPSDTDQPAAAAAPAKVASEPQSASPGQETQASNPGPTATSEPKVFPTTTPPAPSVAKLSIPPTRTPATANPSLTDKVPSRLKRNWKTDFDKHSVAFSEIMSGGPGRDGIPPVDDPKFVDVSNAPEYMTDQEPVIAVEINGDARAYPLAVLIWHEIVNDEVGGVPVTVTYCPLCNTAITFDRRVGDDILDFGTSGLLRNSDLIMWDRQTESWWQQITGEAIVGELLGTKLTFLPTPLISWADFVEAFPDGQVLTRDTGFLRNYGGPPYAGYDQLDRRPFLFRGGIDPRLMAMERVIGLNLDAEGVAYPFALLQESPVVHDKVGDTDLVIFYRPETTSAFAGPGHSDSRQVGSTGVYEPVADGRKLTFVARDGRIVDEETGSEWNILGKAVSGELEGSQLPAVVHANHFWFAWAAFNPDTAVRSVEDVSG
ncbi:MAG: DUF3179 domain-containing protein [Chloroflexi bacterium]|nr:DUF3179 domain-containing protein [Chloroflexota bacterium]